MQLASIVLEVVLPQSHSTAMVILVYNVGLLPSALVLFVSLSVFVKGQ